MEEWGEVMALSVEQAESLAESLADVFVPSGDAGVINELCRQGCCAYVVGRRVDGWYLISALESAETLKGGK